jgi:hypothetical protein
MDFLDSRHLTNHDSFVQLFPAADVFEYFVTSVPAAMTPQHEPKFYLEVKPSTAQKGEGRQHVVKVVWDPRAMTYTADPPRLEIAQNDFVTWHCDRMIGSPPYSVRGRGQQGSFSSASLGPHAAFMHFFLEAGRYAYQVNGAGVFIVEVLDHRKMDPEVYAKRAADAPLVQIRRARPDPREVEIVAGQTVVWLIDEEQGITIALNPQPLPPGE